MFLYKTTIAQSDKDWALPFYWGTACNNKNGHALESLIEKFGVHALAFEVVEGFEK
ncbi:hypothetical protein [Sphingobacterium siyangense]|uniref:hypothetical protein n=1 Tax=Sphingobacterium siyangense TaxID=459529 RepID=UPI003DA46E1A